ncbi:related to protoporphyrinogen oxidase [Phialocephala subalpina]|uniref:Related to protoporphyrinogen oxidase n=1 Tax=Phialocephala subalpina TaxID=576137 RepID=A0A1L7WVS5_9HELO|nr:related to protoporphyrinogen oxidase [Phialocephala subalpina]
MPIWIIIGVNRGLGLEFATQLAVDASNTIIAAIRSLSNCPELEKLQSASKTFHILQCDTSSQDSITEFGKHVSKVIGPETKVDYLLNNAAINANSSLTSLTMNSEALTNHMNTNVMGPAKLVQVLTPHLQEGSVVMNMTSGLASLAYNRSKEMPECTVYAMSKAALNMLTVHQAAHLKEKKVKVVCVDPGWVKTDMGGKSAVLEKEESIGRMLKVLKGLQEGDSGKFFVYDGREMEW